MRQGDKARVRCSNCGVTWVNRAGQPVCADCRALMQVRARRAGTERREDGKRRWIVRVSSGGEAAFQVGSRFNRAEITAMMIGHALDVGMVIEHPTHAGKELLIADTDHSLVRIP